MSQIVRFDSRLILVVMVLVCMVAPAWPQAQDNKPVANEGSKRVEIGSNVFLEIKDGKRRVLVKSYVCLREGLLEMFLCRKYTKEHEAILAADIDARDIHKALLLCEAVPGSPAKFQPKFEPAKGPIVKLTVEYGQNGKVVSMPAQKWVRELKSKKEMHQDWVFAGSLLIPNPLEKDKPPTYAANYGDVICLANFEGALLDIPIKSSNDNEEIVFEANTTRIPPLQTPVTLILEPVLPAKK